MSLPEAALFEAQSVSEVWLEVVERTSKFLRSVVLGGESLTLGSASAQPASPIPMADRHTALSLLLEFSVLKGYASTVNDRQLIRYNALKATCILSHRICTTNFVQ